MPDSRPVRIVTDSTSDIPSKIREELGIVVVPLTVTFDSESFLDGVEITPPEFIARLRTSTTLPKTAQPTAAAFEEAMRPLIDDGADIVCITISSDLSGTYNSARLAAEPLPPGRVHLVDSRATTMQLGWVTVAAARAAAAGESVEHVHTIATDAISRVRLFAVLQTLDYVYKGGRIGKAAQLAGSALAIKPVLSIVDGIVVPIERVRTWKRAIGRAIDLTAEHPEATDIIVLHSENLADAERTADALRTSCPNASISIDYAGSTIGTYAGPGAIGIASLLPVR